jgi:hypothetical protein
MSAQNKSAEEKILFRLEKGADDYPPVDWESLWAQRTGDGLYSIDNIPFYLRGISPGDIVSVKEKGGELFFREVEEFSDHSVIRVIVHDGRSVEELRDRMVEFGCDFEGSHIPGFTAFDLPPSVNFDKVTAFLQDGEDKGFWEYEEASRRPN